MYKFIIICLIIPYSSENGGGRLDFYMILGIEKTASNKEIKKAYVQKIRQFPPDQYPEEFKEIRKAYETLNDPKMRLEYDTMSDYGEEIEQHLEAGLAAVGQEDYEGAIQHYKRILLIQPKLNYVRNYYALALSYKGEHNKALAQFLRLAQEESKNALYQYNLGMEYSKLERHAEALSFIREALRLDPENIDFLFDLADLLQSLDRTDEARRAILDAVKGRSAKDFATFIYLFKWLQLEVYEKQIDGIEAALNQIESLLEGHPEERLYVAGRYAKFAYELFQYKLYKWAVFLTERAVELDPEDDSIRKLHEVTVQNKPVYEEYERMRNDPEISEWVRKFYAIYLFGDEVSEEEFEKYNENAFDNLYQASRYEPDPIIRSIRRMIVTYPHLYEQRKEWLQKFMEIGKQFKALDDQYGKMKDDPQIVHSVKRFVALLLAEDLSKEEQAEYFNDIMDEMNHDYTADIVTSLKRLKTYASLYQLNTKLFDGLLTDAQEVQRQQPQPQTTSSHKRPPSSSSSHRTSGGGGYSPPASSGSSSCFVATAAYGSPLAEELDVLRLWRDRVLQRTLAGRSFIAFYYRLGPLAAKAVERSEWLKSSVRFIVYRILCRLDKRYELSTMAEKNHGRTAAH